MDARIIDLALAVIGFYLVLRWDVWDDWKKNSVRHTKEAVTRAVLLIPSLILFTLAAGIGWKSVLTALAMIFFAWWTLFDGWLNRKKGHPYWFTGSDDPDDAKSDNFLQGLTLWQHKAVKLGGWGLSMGIYIFILLK